MELNSNNSNAFFKQALDKNISAMLIFGKDTGLITINIEKLRKILKVNKKNITIHNINLEQVNSEPNILIDNLNSISMFSDKNIIYFRAHGSSPPSTMKKVISELEIWLKNNQNNNDNNTILIIEARDLNKKSPLRKLFAKYNNTLSLICYPDTIKTIEAFINEFCKNRKLSITQEAKTYILEHVTLNRSIINNELNKLTIYLDDKHSNITIDDVKNSIANSTTASPQDIINAVIQGNLTALDKSLQSYYNESKEDPPISLLRIILNTFERILDACYELNIEHKNLKQVSLRYGLFNLEKSLPHLKKNSHIILNAIAKLCDCEQECILKYPHIGRALTNRCLISITAEYKNIYNTKFRKT